MALSVVRSNWQGFIVAKEREDYILLQALVKLFLQAYVILFDRAACLLYGASILIGERV